MSMSVHLDGVDITDSITFDTGVDFSGAASTTLTFAYPPAKGSIVTTTGATSGGGWFTTTYPATGTSTMIWPTITGYFDPIPPEARRAMQEAIIDCSVLSLKRRYESDPRPA